MQHKKVEEFNWKGWLKIILGIIISILTIRMLAFGLIVGGIWKFFDAFNKEFDRNQSSISRILDRTEKDAEIANLESEILAMKFDAEVSGDMERGKIRSGKDLAEYVIKVKKDYEFKMEDCRHDKECMSYLNNQQRTKNN